MVVEEVALAATAASGFGWAVGYHTAVLAGLQLHSAPGVQRESTTQLFQRLRSVPRSHLQVDHQQEQQASREVGASLGLREW